MTVGNAENVKTTEAQVEAVAQAFYAEAHATEALWQGKPRPSFDDADDSAQKFCRALARVAIAAMQAAAPPEDDPEPPKDDEDEYGPDREETDDR